MPIANSGSVQAGSGQIIFGVDPNANQVGLATATAPITNFVATPVGSTGTLSGNATTTSTGGLLQVSGRNLGGGAQVYSDSVNANQAGILDFRTIKAGIGVQLVQDDTSITINMGALTNGSLSFFSLAEMGASSIPPNAVMASNASAKVAFVPNSSVAPPMPITSTGAWPAPALQPLFLTQDPNTHTISWQNAPAPGVFGFDVLGSSDIVATGGPITSQGTINLGLVPTGVAAGSYLAPTLAIDSNGRITAATSNVLGEINTASSIGFGHPVFAQKTGVDMQFKSLVPSSNLAFTSSASDITLDLAPTGVIGGTYVIPTITVDNNGRITTVTAGSYPVASVAGKTGAVTLVPGDITGLAMVATSGAFADLSGSLLPAQMPALTGDVTVAAGTTVTTIAPTGVAAGSYPKVTVNSKGQVTAGALLTAADLPAYIGASAGSAATAGAVPAAAAGQQADYLRGDGTWAMLPVSSVAGKTGAVLLSAADISGLSAIATSGSAADLSGTLNVAQMPTLTGDAMLAAGTNVLTLAPTGVTAGTYIKVTVNGKGLVTGSSPLLATDLPLMTGATGGAAGTAGAVVAPVAGEQNDFLRGDGSWQPLATVATSGLITDTIGSLTAARLPAFTGGDVTAAAGSTALVLNASGVTAGTYAKVTVNAKGLVTGASTLAAADLPTSGIDASWITLGTLAATHLPALSGDVVSSAGSAVTTLAPSGVTAGSYAKVTVNAKGIVTASGPLLVSDLPTTGYSATWLTTGTLNAAQLPAFTGDATVPAGSSVITLAASGVTAGSYPKVTVNAKGLVTAATVLANTDVPAFTGATSTTPGTLGGVPVPSAGQQNYFLKGDGSWGPMSASLHYVNASYNAVANESVLVDTSAGSLTINLPLAPSVGTTATFYDAADTWGINAPVFMTPDAKLIRGSAASVTYTPPTGGNAAPCVMFAYVNATIGWQYFI